MARRNEGLWLSRDEGLSGDRADRDPANEISVGARCYWTRHNVWQESPDTSISGAQRSRRPGSLCLVTLTITVSI